MPKLSDPMKNALRYFVRRDYYQNTGKRPEGSISAPKNVTCEALVRRGYLSAPVMADNGLDVITPYALTLDGLSVITHEGLAATTDEAIFANKCYAAMYAEIDAAEVRAMREEAARREIMGNGTAYAENDGSPMYLTNEEIAEGADGDPIVEALIRAFAPRFGFTTENPPTTGAIEPLAELIAQDSMDEALSAILAGEGADSAPKEDSIRSADGENSPRAQRAFDVFRGAIEYLLPGHGELVNHAHDFGTRIQFCTNLAYEDVRHLLCVQAALVKAVEEIREGFGGIGTGMIDGYVSAVIYTADDMYEGDVR